MVDDKKGTKDGEENEKAEKPNLPLDRYIPHRCD